MANPGTMADLVTSVRLRIPLRETPDDQKSCYGNGIMSVSERLQQAAERLLWGDESMRAAQALEGVLIEEYLGDDRTEALLCVLSLYSPGSGVPYAKASDVRTLVLSTLESLV